MVVRIFKFDTNNAAFMWPTKRQYTYWIYRKDEDFLLNLWKNYNIFFCCGGGGILIRITGIPSLIKIIFNLSIFSKTWTFHLHERISFCDICFFFFWCWLLNKVLCQKKTVIIYPFVQLLTIWKTAHVVESTISIMVKPFSLIFLEIWNILRNFKNFAYR